MIHMMKRITTNNGMVLTIETEYRYVSIVEASEYIEDAEGFMILWWNPCVCNGENQIDSEVFPFTVEGIMKATSEARALNNQIRQQVEDNTFTFRC